MKKILKNQENKIVLGVMILTIIVALSPLVSRYCINGHDLDYHLLRMEALKENILMGRPFLKVDPLFFGGAGYASSMFYSDFLLYIPALLRVAGVSINASYHFYVGMCAVLCMLSAYYCTWKITNSKYTGLIAGVLLMLCPYHMDDLMVRAAAGEFMAFIFVPFVIYGIYNAIYEEMNKPWVLGVGFAGVILSHTATTVMCIMFAAVACIINIKVFIKNTKILVRIVITAIVTALFTAIYWLPMLEQFLSSKFFISSGGGVDMLDAAVDFSQILSQSMPTVGICLLIPVVFRFFISSKDNQTVKYADWLMIGGAAFCLLATNIMPWEYMSRVLSFVQFPWRFFLIASVLFAMADSIVIGEFVKNFGSGEKNNWNIAIAVVFIAMSYLALIHQNEISQGYYDYSNDYYSFKPYTCNVIGGEWLPEGATSDYNEILEQSEKLISDNGNELDFVREKGNVYSNLTNDYEYVDVPLLYYKGYTARITNNDGTVVNLLVSGEGKNNFCRVYTKGIQGMLSVSYKGTRMLYLSYILTIIGIGLSTLYIYKNKGKTEE